MRSQWFTVARDPGGVNYLFEAPGQADHARGLTCLVLAGWYPDWVDAQIREQSANLAVMVPWAEKTTPSDTVRWDLRPEWDYLDDPQVPYGRERPRAAFSERLVGEGVVGRVALLEVKSSCRPRKVGH